MWPFRTKEQKEQIRQKREEEKKKHKEILEEMARHYPIGSEVEHMGRPVYVLDSGTTKKEGRICPAVKIGWYGNDGQPWSKEIIGSMLFVKGVVKPKAEEN